MFYSKLGAAAIPQKRKSTSMQIVALDSSLTGQNTSVDVSLPCKSVEDLPDLKKNVARRKIRTKRRKRIDLNDSCENFGSGSESSEVVPVDEEHRDAPRKQFSSLIGKNSFSSRSAFKPVIRRSSLVERRIQALESSAGHSNLDRSPLMLPRQRENSSFASNMFSASGIIFPSECRGLISSAANISGNVRTLASANEGNHVFCSLPRSTSAHTDADAILPAASGRCSPLSSNETAGAHANANSQTASSESVHDWSNLDAVSQWTSSLMAELDSLESASLCSSCATLVEAAHANATNSGGLGGCHTFRNNDPFYTSSLPLIAKTGEASSACDFKLCSSVVNLVADKDYASMQSCQHENGNDRAGAFCRCGKATERLMKHSQCAECIARERQSGSLHTGLVHSLDQRTNSLNSDSFRSSVHTQRRESDENCAFGVIDGPLHSTHAASNIRDAFTQTTPLNLSRAASFTYLTELELEDYDHSQSRRTSFQKLGSKEEHFPAILSHACVADEDFDKCYHVDDISSDAFACLDEARGWQELSSGQSFRRPVAGNTQRITNSASSYRESPLPLRTCVSSSVPDRVCEGKHVAPADDSGDASVVLRTCVERTDDAALRQQVDSESRRFWNKSTPASSKLASAKNTEWDFNGVVKRADDCKHFPAASSMRTPSSPAVSATTNNTAILRPPENAVLVPSTVLDPLGHRAVGDKSSSQYATDKSANFCLLPLRDMTTKAATTLASGHEKVRCSLGPIGSAVSLRASNLQENAVTRLGKNSCGLMDNSLGCANGTISGNETDLYPPRSARTNQLHWHECLPSHLPAAEHQIWLSAGKPDFERPSALMSQSVYDNVVHAFNACGDDTLQPLLDSRESLCFASPRATVPTDESFCSSLSQNAFAHGNADISRDISMTSGVLADSEYSPLSPNESRAFFDVGETSSCTANQLRKPSTVQPSSNNALLSTTCDEHSLAYDRFQHAKKREDRLHSFVADVDHSAARSQLRNSLPALDDVSAASSLEALNNKTAPQVIRYRNQCSSRVLENASSRKDNLQSEARQCCRWLRAAGFPQYAQLYQDGQFPVEIKSVQRDHQFLDSFEAEPLLRRLQTLNHCAIMNADSWKRRAATPDEDSDDEEDVALSKQWRYQRKSKTWSRVASGDATAESGGESLKSCPIYDLPAKLPKANDTLMKPPQPGSLFRNEEKADLPMPEHSSAPSASSRQRFAQTTEDIVEFSSPGVERRTTALGKGSSKLNRSQSERIKDGAKAFVRLVRNGRQTLRTSSRGAAAALPKDEKVSPAASVDIGAPVLVSHQSASLAAMQTSLNVRCANNSCATSSLTEAEPGRSGFPARVAQSGDPVSPLTHVKHTRLGSLRNENWRHGKVFANGSESPVSERPQNPCNLRARIDANYNSVANVFVPRLPKPDELSNVLPPSGSRSGSLGRTGIRTNANVRPDSCKQPRLPQSRYVAGAAFGWTKWDGLENHESARSDAIVNGTPKLSFHNPAFERPLASAFQQKRCMLQSQDVAGFSSSKDNSRSMPNYAKPQYPTSFHSDRSRAFDAALRVAVDRDATGTADVNCNESKRALGGSSLECSDTDSPRHWERRDSGVGSSLSRSPSVPLKSRVRWHSFQRSYKPKQSENCSPQMDSLSVAQISTLQKFALLKLTALMEKYSPSNKSNGWNWSVQRLLRKMKSPDYKTTRDGGIFGVPLLNIAQRTGQPLPQCILMAMKFLREHAAETVGIFRKSGVRSRIQKLKAECESSTALLSFESCQAYDVADMLKQYFRELNEPLLTLKMSETLINLQLCLPSALRFEAIQKAVLLLPDECREALQTVLTFLHDVSVHCDTNQMTAQNLAVCLAPTLFQLSARVRAVSPTRRHKTIAGGGLPTEKELKENRAAQELLTEMIVHCGKLFSIPDDMFAKYHCTQNEEAVPALLSELSLPGGNYLTYLEGCIDALLKEHRDKWKGWMTAGSIDNVELSTKKVQSDDYPLRLWRCWTEVEAPPKELLERILRERNIWDEDVIKWRVVSKLCDNCELFQYVCNDMPPHPRRDYLVVRLWQRGLASLRGVGCVLVETSVTAPEVSSLGGIRGVCLASRYLIEPCGSGRSRITHVVRMDTRGRSKGWFNKIFGHICGTHLAKIRDSLRQITEGPETKV